MSTQPARYVFAALVVATFAAFFVAQRLKNAPTVIQHIKIYPFFSPNGDGNLDRARIRFVVRKHDEVTVDVVDSAGDRVKRLVEDRDVRYREVFVKWDGREDDGRMAPDGRYRVRVLLRGDGRSIVLPRVFVKDTRPPVVRVTGRRAQPQILPLRGGAVVSFVAPPGHRRRVSVFRTYPGPVTRVAGPVTLGADVSRWRWDGTGAGGRRLRPGTYLAVVESRDSADNLGSSAPMAGRLAARHPVIRYGQDLRDGSGRIGHGGITIRYLGVQPPVGALVAGKTATLDVDARGRAFSWSLRRAGGATLRRSGGTRRGSQVKVPLPGGESGLFVLTTRSGTHVTETPLPVRAPDAGRRRVLVVVPYMTWQGTNPADSDGDGAVDTLSRGVGAGLQRVMVGDGSGLPAGLARQDAPLVAYLDREHHRYDITTDLALAVGIGPKLGDYHGVLLTGDERWVPQSLGRALIAYVRGGGRVASVGTASLRAQADLSPKRTQLTDPTPLAADDVFGARYGALVRRIGTITAIEPDRLRLFVDGTGELRGFASAEPTLSAGADATVLSKATLSDGKAVVVGARYGKGVVIRTGLPDLAARLRDDRNVQALMEQTWTRLSR